MAPRALEAWLLPRRRLLAGGVVLRARGREQFLESMAVVAIFSILMGIAVTSYRTIVVKLPLVEAASLVVAYRTEAAVEVAVTGELPRNVVTTDGAKVPLSRTFERVDWRDREVVFEIKDELATAMAAGAARPRPGPASLSFRAARSADSSRLVMLCGLARPPAGFTAEAARHTSVPEQYLPHFCRS